MRPSALAEYKALSAAAISSSVVRPCYGKPATPNEAVTLICDAPWLTAVAAIA